jgi:RNA polymerase sigma-70 factor, ECF subfamily
MPTGLDAMVMEEGVPAASDPVDLAVNRFQDGDRAAFETLLTLTEATVPSLAWRLLGDKDPARDAAQEVYLRVYRSLGGFRRGENFRAWLYRITVNVCWDHVRKRGPAMVPMEDRNLPVRPAEGAEEAVLRAERRALVQRALGALTPAERSALVLRDLEGLDTSEVARVLGVKPVTVRSQLSTARAKVQAFCATLLQGAPGGRP